MTAPHPSTWLRKTDAGLYCVPGDFYLDPHRAVPRAVITHGHADHARPGNEAVLATPATAAIMRARYRERAGAGFQEMAYGATVRVGDVDVRFVPAGHVLGSAQAVLDYKGSRIVLSGDYKRRPDPTCDAFEPVPCDVFITEATFGLPVFRHPDDRAEIAKIPAARDRFPDRCVVVGVYGLGKAQRVIRLLREAGVDEPLYIHGALEALCALYEELGVALGPLIPATGVAKADLVGKIVLAPPSALADRWSRRLPEPITAVASGWMRVRQRAKQRGVELPLIVSDHADWDELLATIEDVDAPEIWVTHGREEALVHVARQAGRSAEALSLVGFEDESE